MIRFFILFVVFLVVNGWGECHVSTIIKITGSSWNTPEPQLGVPTAAPKFNCETCSPSTSWQALCSGCDNGADNSITACLNTTYGGVYRTKCNISSWSQGGGQVIANGVSFFVCDSKCAADSLNCVTDGNLWNSSECACSNGCVDEKNECESYGGTFNGTVLASEGCCRGVCNLCNGGAMDAMYEAKSKICCENGLAPPDKSQTCMSDQNIPSGCGVAYSTYGDFTSGGWECGDPSTDFEAAKRYREQCLATSSSSDDNDNSSSSGDGGDSSSSGNNPDYGDCKECPWLDSILDTLTAQKHVVEDVYSCLTNKALCSFGNSIDSMFINVPELVKLDTSIHYQKEQIENLKKIDTVLNRLDTSLDYISRNLYKDSAFRQLVQSMGVSLESSISSNADSSKKYLKQVVNKIGSSADSIMNGLGRIIDNMPNDILDSILKYQKYSIDNLDSLGNGFAKIDDLTDSAIKYFKEGYRFDSIYNTQYRDSLGAIHTAINDIGSNIGYGLGYGDTASSTLRKDLNGIKDGLDELNGKFDAAVVDTGSVGFGSSWVSDGERMGDSIGRAVGWIGGLDGVDLDSAFAAGSWDDSIYVDSIGRVVDDSLSFIADSLNNILVAQNDSIKRGLPDSLSVWADSLVSYSPFASFDSLIFGQLGAKIPNSNQCPEDCQKWTINLPRFGLFAFEVDYGLCLGRAPLGGMNVLGFIRLLLRIVVVWSCIWIVFNALTRRKD